VRDNAHQYNNTIKEELHRVIFHGVLHLCGYKDKSIRDQKKMRQKEDQYLSSYKTFHVKK
jgi:rRNA maturation RNase YbeY